MFLENSAVITRAYICAMEQTTVLKPELRFFQNRFIGKDFNLYSNSDYDEEEIAQEVMAITGRRIDVENDKSRAATQNQKIKVQDSEDDYENYEDDYDYDDLQIFKQKNLSKRLISKQEKCKNKKVNELMLDNKQIKINGEKLLKLTEAVEKLSQNTNNQDKNLCFESTNQIGDFLAYNQLIRIENGEEQDLEQFKDNNRQKDHINLPNDQECQSINESLKQFRPKGLQINDNDDVDDFDDDQDDQIDLGTIEDNDEELKPYISQSWGGIRVFGTARNHKLNQKTPVSQRYQNIQIDSTSSSIQLARSSSKQNHILADHQNSKIINQDYGNLQQPIKITPRMIAQRGTLVLDQENIKLKQSSIQFKRVMKQGGKFLDDLALEALIQKEHSITKNQGKIRENFAQGIQALAVNTARITHSETSEKLNEQQSESSDNNNNGDCIDSSQYDQDRSGDKELLQNDKAQALNKLKLQIEQQQRRKNQTLRLQLEEAHNFQYVPNYTQKTNTLFPGTNRSQFTVIALETPKCIPIEFLQQQLNRQGSSSSKSPTVRQFFKPQTQEPDNPFLQFNFFYRYTSNAPRFTRAKNQQDQSQVFEEKKKQLQDIFQNGTLRKGDSPQAKIQRAQKRSSFSNQRILVIKIIRNYKVIALKIQDKSKQGCKIIILTDQNIKSQLEQQQKFEQKEEQLVARIDTDKIMKTIMTDQAINIGSPVGGQIKSQTKQSGSVSKDQVLIIDANWLRQKSLKGFSSMKDVERKIQKFIQLVDLRGMIHYHKAEKKHHSRYHSNLSNKQRKLIST